MTVLIFSIFMKFAFADLNELVKIWQEHLEVTEGEVRVHAYCENQSATESRAVKFDIAEGSGRVIISSLLEPIPLMPPNLSETAQLRKSFVYLDSTQISLLDESERTEYLQLEKRMKIYDKFTTYINSLNCFEHSSFGIRFSVAKNLVWKSEVKLKSNLRDWKADIYEADIEMGSSTEKKFIFIGPCPVNETNQKCLEMAKTPEKK